MGSEKGTQRRQRLPCVKGAGSRVSRKRETDEGYLPLPMGEVPLEGAERVYFFPLSHFVTAPPEWEPRGTDCDRRESPEGVTPALRYIKV